MPGARARPAVLARGCQAVEPLQPGDPPRVGKYLLLSRLGSGGMGRVFLGRSPGGRLVAVKLIRSGLASDPEFRSRFAREVAAARRVGGIFTAPVVDADPDAPEPWLVTAYVDGPSLADRVASQGPLPASSVVTLAAGLAEGLGAIHATGMVHRDLKPSNVILANDGPRIIDFGISRALDATSMTHADMLVGSPGFMSPEQAQGREAGPESDIFSLGCLLTFAATGQSPFGTGSLAAVLYRVVYGPPATGGLYQEIRPLVERCLAKYPQQRPTADDLLAELGSARAEPDWLPWTAPGVPGPPPAMPSPPPAEPPGPRTAAPAPSAMVPGPPPAEAPSPPAEAPSPPAGAPGPPPGAPGPPAVGEPSATTSAGQYQAWDDTRQFPGARPAGVATPRRRLTWMRAAGALAALLTVAAAALVITSGWSTIAGRGPSAGNSRDHSPSASPTSPGPPSPRAVVEAFYAAINRRDWPRVWQLGGKNLNQSYPAMVAGYRQTRHDVLTAIKTRGNSVVARLLAYETNGTVQTYRLSYVVQGGVITSGHGQLLATGQP